MNVFSRRWLLKLKSLPVNLMLAAVIACGILVAGLKKLHFTAPQSSWRLLPYGIGSIAAFWTIERVASFLPVAS